VVKTAMAGKQQAKTESFGYVEVPQTPPPQPENFRDKFVRKTKENPLVPIGM